MHHGSKNRLMPHHAELFLGDTLFARVARAVCSAGVLPRKELYECWEVARRVRRKFRGGRVVDWACGHGLLAHLMLILDDTSQEALAYDVALPKSAGKLQAAMVRAWPRIADRVTLIESSRAPALHKGDVVVSCHACGGLTDEVLGQATAARAFVAVLPCCHHDEGDDGGLRGWLDLSVAIDVTRAATLRASAYDVWTQKIPDDITPKNRLLIAAPRTAPRVS